MRNCAKSALSGIGPLLCMLVIWIIFDSQKAMSHVIPMATEGGAALVSNIVKIGYPSHYIEGIGATRNPVMSNYSRSWFFLDGTVPETSKILSDQWLLRKIKQH